SAEGRLPSEPKRSSERRPASIDLSCPPLAEVERDGRWPQSPSCEGYTARHEYSLGHALNRPSSPARGSGCGGRPPPPPPPFPPRTAPSSGGSVGPRA